MTQLSDNTAAPGTGSCVFRCDSCNHQSRVKSELAGRRVRCPKCGKVGRVRGVSPARDGKSTPIHLSTPVPRPEPAVREAPLVREGTYIGKAPTNETESRPAAPVRRAEPTMRCPYCREEILLAARKCKHCGEFLDESLREMMDHKKSSASRGRRHESSGEPMQIPWRPIVICAVVLVAIGGGLYGWQAWHKPASATGADPAKAAQVSAGFQPVFHSLKKSLEGTEFKDAGGSVTQFLKEADGEVWETNVPKPQDGKPAHASVLAPYRLNSNEVKTASSRGKLILDFVCKGGAWQLMSVTRRAIFVTDKQGPNAGKEREVPEDDQQAFRLRDNDPLMARIRGVASKSAPGSDD